MSAKSKSALSGTPNAKASPTPPRAGKTSRGVAKSDSDSASPVPNARLSADRSPRPVASKSPVDRPSPKLITPPDKKTPRILKPSELQAELKLAQEDLKKVKEKLVSVDNEKAKALDELKNAQGLAEEANEKLREALQAQKRAEENFEIEKFRAVEMEQAAIEAALRKEEEWQKELEALRNQHAVDVAALLSADEELVKVKHELAMTCDAKEQAMAHIDDATKKAAIHAEKVEALSSELTCLKAELDSRVEMEMNEKNKIASYLKLELDSLRQELQRAKSFEEKLAEKEAMFEQLNVDLLGSKLEMDSLRQELGSAKSFNEELAEKDATLEQLNAYLSESKLEIDSLRQELGKAKSFEEKLAEKEAMLEQLNVHLSESKLEIDSLRKELGNSKSFEENLAEKEAMLEQLNVDLSESKLERDSLRQELGKAKSFEEKLAEKEGILEQLNVDLEAAKLAESYAHNLAAELHERVKELESQANQAQRLERSASESLESVMKQLEGSNDSLQEAESEIAALKEKMGLLEISIRRQKVDLEESERRTGLAKKEASEMAKKVEFLESELETLREEKTQALNHEKLAAASVQTLLEEKNKLINELETSRDEEEKSKKALESLASALHEVSCEARDAKEKLFSVQAAHENYETQIEDMKLVMKATSENYESMLNDARQEIDALTNSIEQSKHGYENLMSEWEQKELHLVNYVKKSEEEKSSLESEINRLVNLLKLAEEEACATRDECDHWKSSSKEAESELINLKEVLGETRAESARLKEDLMDRENEFQNVVMENEELQKREAASVKKVEELSKLLEEALAKKQGEENGELTDSEKEYDMLPKVVEFSEQNGKGNLKPKANDIHNDESKTAAEVGNHNDKLKDNGDKENDNEDSAVVDHKMWESCKIDEKDFSVEGDHEQESIDDELESKTGSVDGYDQANGVSLTENLDNRESPPSKSQSHKKKKRLLGKFGSLLKKKGPTNEK